MPNKPYGRPLKFKSTAALKKAVDKYFDSCYEEKIVFNKKTGEVIMDKKGQIVKEKVKTRPYTIAGLCLALEIGRTTLHDYASGNNDLKEEELEGLDDKQKSKILDKYGSFSNIIAHARMKVMKENEEGLYRKESARGCEFNLKANFEVQEPPKRIETTGANGGPIQTENNTTLAADVNVKGIDKKSLLALANMEISNES